MVYLASSSIAGSFLQSNDAEDLRQVLASANLRQKMCRSLWKNGRLSDRDAVASLLSGEAPSSGVLGALEPLR